MKIFDRNVHKHLENYKLYTVEIFWVYCETFMKNQTPAFNYFNNTICFLFICTWHRILSRDESIQTHKSGTNAADQCQSTVMRNSHKVFSMNILHSICEKSYFGNSQAKMCVSREKETKTFRSVMKNVKKSKGNVKNVCICLMLFLAISS